MRLERARAVTVGLILIGSVVLGAGIIIAATIKALS
jgi:hypothetical protein